MTFELRFHDPSRSLKYRKDLSRQLAQEHLWSEHALSYDAVLGKSSDYNELLSTMTGEIGPLAEVPQDARVLDLGTGTGNLTHKLASSSDKRVIYALDKNPGMLEVLSKKCQRFMSQKQGCSTVFGMKRDIGQLSLGTKKARFVMSMGP